MHNKDNMVAITPESKINGGILKKRRRIAACFMVKWQQQPLHYDVAQGAKWQLKTNLSAAKLDDEKINSIKTNTNNWKTYK